MFYRGFKMVFGFEYVLIFVFLYVIVGNVFGIGFLIVDFYEYVFGVGIRWMVVVIFLVLMYSVLCCFCGSFWILCVVMFVIVY